MLTAVVVALVAAATLAVPPAAADDVAPTITLQPVSQSAVSQQNVTLTADASPYTSVQWERRTPGTSTWAAISGATSTTYAATYTKTYELRAVFANGTASTATDVATVTYYGWPDIWTQPSPITKAPGTPATLQATVLCSCPSPDVFWERSTDSGATWTRLAGGTFVPTDNGQATGFANASFSFDPLDDDDGGLYRLAIDNSPGGINRSNAVAVTLTEAPAVSITGSFLGPIGATRTLTATLSKGFPEPTFQWQERPAGGSTWSDVAGETDSTFTRTFTDAMHGRSVRVIATNAYGAATSSAVTYQVGIAPEVTADWPADIVAHDGDEIVLATTGTGQPTPTISWKRQLVTIPGFTDPTRTFILGTGTAGTYEVTYTNRIGTAKRSVRVLIGRAGTISVSPTTVYPRVGQTRTITATQPNAPYPATVPTWERSLDGGTTWEPLGHSGTTLVVTGEVALDGAKYRAVTTNDFGTAVSNTSTLSLYDDGLPTVTLQPTEQRPVYGDPATFTAAATAAGTAPTVQWQRSDDGGTTWGDIEGATDPTYSFLPVPADDSSSYRAVFTNDIGTTNSNAALLRVGFPTGEVVADQPYFQYAGAPGGAANVGNLRATFSATGITGYPEPTVTWVRNYYIKPCTQCPAQSGSTTIGSGTTLTVPGITLPNYYTYTYVAQITNSVGTYSVGFTPLVAQAPVVSAHPPSRTVSPGAEVVLAAAATGTPTPAVQWERSEVGSSTWEDVPGATSSSLTVTVPSGGADPRYRARYTSVAGTVRTFAATLTRDGSVPSVTASLSSASPPVGGAYAGPVTVDLVAADDRAVESITWESAGATVSGPTTVSGSTLQTVVDALGTSTITYAARDRAGNVSAPQTVDVTILGAAPAAPSGVSAGLGDGSSLVSWSAPNPADVVAGYEITPVRDGVPEAVQVFGAGTSALVTGLTNGSSYRFSVVAVNAFGPGLARLSPAVTVGVPSHPSSLRSAPGNGSASLTWAPPPAMGVDPTGYEITPLLDGVTPSAPTTVGAVTGATITGLANGSTYTFRIVTLSANGAGPGATFPAVVVGVPIFPSGLKATPGNGVAHLSWTPPPAMGVAPTGYEITPLLDGVTPLAPTTVGAVTSTTITGLANGSTYTFRIVTLSPHGTSAPVVFPPVTVGVLNPPTTLRTSSGNGQATLTWVEPVTVGITVTGYRITPVKGGVLQAPIDIGPGTSTVVTGLTNGSVYSFRVVALSAYGSSSNATFPAVTIGVPGHPTGLSAVAGDGQATVSWTAPPDIGVAVTGYRITPYIGSTAQPATTTSGPGTSAVVSGLANGTSYTFRVVTLSAWGESGYAKSMAVKIGTVGAPKLPRATAGNAQATLTWQPPTDTGIPVAGYRITPYLGAVQLAPTTVGPVTTTVIADLVNGSTYTFRVEALSVGGTGTAGIAPAVTIGVPTFPSTLRSYPGDGEATLTWVAPPDIGVPVTGYRITPYIGGVAQPDITVGPVLTTTVGGLTNGTTYTFRIATLTEHGASATAKFPDVTPTAAG